jgi:hypothetical protein
MDKELPRSDEVADLVLSTIASDAYRAADIMAAMKRHGVPLDGQTLTALSLVQQYLGAALDAAAACACIEEDADGD